MEDELNYLSRRIDFLTIERTSIETQMRAMYGLLSDVLVKEYKNEIRSINDELKMLESILSVLTINELEKS